MMRLKILSALFISILAVTCASRKTTVTKEVYQINFGSMGGFTGMKQEFCLKESGMLYTLKDSSGISVYTLLKQADTAAVKKIFRYAVSAEFLSLNLKQEANMTGFIAVYRDSTPLQAIKWPFGEKLQAPVADSLSSLLFALLP